VPRLITIEEMAAFKMKEYVFEPRKDIHLRIKIIS
jgi:hypothetical protein